MEHLEIFTPRYHSGYIVTALKAGVGNFFKGLCLLPGASWWLYNPLLMKYEKKTEKLSLMSCFIASWLIKSTAKKTQLLFCSCFWEKKLIRMVKNDPKMGVSKKKGTFLCFFLDLLRIGSSKGAEGSLHCIKCIKMLLLSHKNKIFIKFSHFYLLRLLRRWQCWYGVPWSEPRPEKHLAAPAMKAVLINPECYQGVKISKCPNIMYPKTP